MSEKIADANFYGGARQSAQFLTRDAGVLLRVQTLLRWLAVSGQSVTIFIVGFVLEYQMPLLSCIGLVLMSVAVNIGLWLYYPSNYRLSPKFAAAYLLYDLLQLTALLFMTGGLANPFIVMILAPVTVSATVLTARATLLLVGMSCAVISLLAYFHMPLPWKGQPPNFPEIYLLGVWAALMLGLAFISAYVWRISHEGRRMSAASTALQQVLAREHRLSALDGLAAAAAHQLGTPLGTIGLIAKELQSSPLVDSELAEDLQSLLTETKRCKEILSSLTTQSDQGDTIFSRMSLSALIQEAIDEAGGHDKDIFVKIEPEDISEPYIIRQPEIIYGLGNLIENAGEFAINSVAVTSKIEAQSIEILVSDDGPGFAYDILPRLGEPWLTSRPASGDMTAQSGMGLGFFIAKTLLERTGGQVVATNKTSPEKGAMIKVKWSRAVLETIPEV
ncbi:MAG: two-component sensor histidine kinase [Rhodobiaceae bacterium]|nr:two-component sensor histidine kinase [Rhodobiaceae bacterium]